MEPVTHFLTGACLGRAGFNRKTAYATLAAVLAAEAADIDIVWGFAGPVEELKHHRGITHTFIAAPVVAGVVVGVVALFHFWRERRRRKAGGAPGADTLNQNGRVQAAPIRWGWLYATALIAALSHLLQDWTNNYGVRPFFPFNPRWYAGSFMFIADPIVWALLLLAMFVPWILRLTDREIGARQEPFRGRGWAIVALAGMLVLGCLRWAEHAHALAMLGSTQIASEPVVRMAAEPYPVNPFHWHAIVETTDYYQTAEIDTRTGSIESDPHRDVIYKPTDTAAVEAAKRTFLGRVYLDWGRWAVVRDMGQEPVVGLDPPQLPPDRTWTTVEFTDLRFDYAFLRTRMASGSPPLSGWVYMVYDRESEAPADGSLPVGWEDGGEAMDGRVQK